MIKKSMEILIPAYNEEGNVQVVVEKSLKWLKSNTDDYNVLVVDDGSTDKTLNVLKKMEKKFSNLKVISHKKNLGIGMAWRTLYENSSKELLFTCPADQQFNPEDFSKVIDYIDKADIISIYRNKKEQYTFFKSALSYFNRFLIKLLFNFDLKDVNWVKMYRKEVFQKLDLKLKSSLVETEILAKAKKRNFKIIEIGLNHHPRIYGKSNSSGLKQLFRVCPELIKLYFIIDKFK